MSLGEACARDLRLRRESDAYRPRRHRGRSRHGSARRHVIDRCGGDLLDGGRRPACRSGAGAGRDGLLRDERAAGTTVMHDSGPNGLDGSGRPHRRHLGRRVRRRHRLQLGASATGGAAAVARARDPGPRQPEPRAGQRAVHDRAPLPDPGELRQHHPEGPGPDAGRAVEDPGPRRHPVVPVQGLGRPGGDRRQDPAQRRAVAQPDLRADVDRRDDVRRRESSATARTARPARSTTTSR